MDTVAIVPPELCVRKKQSGRPEATALGDKTRDRRGGDRESVFSRRPSAASTLFASPTARRRDPVRNPRVCVGASRPSCVARGILLHFPRKINDYFGVILMATTGQTLSQAMQKMQESSFAGAAFLAEAG